MVIEQNTQVLHALVIAFGKVCQSSLILLTWMILENLKQNVLEIGSMLGKEKGLKSLWTTDLWPMISMWEGSGGNYLRRTLLMISTSVKFSKSQKAQRDTKTLIVHIYLSVTSKNNWCAVSQGSVTLNDLTLTWEAEALPIGSLLCFDILPLFISLGYIFIFYISYLVILTESEMVRKLFLILH